ncbi:MAG: NAD-dependent epimerase/dehydratase family protein [Acidimicrobiales bacterium]
MRTIERALVLGGAGFLGSWLVDLLAAEGIGTIVVDNAADETAEGRDGTGHRIRGDVLSVDLRSLIVDHRIDAVFHFATAAYVPPSVDDPLQDLEHNVSTTIAVLEAARRSGMCPMIVLASSAAVYGEGVRMPIDEEHPLEPVSPYGVSKLAAEQYLRLYHHLYGLPCIAVRMFSLYGPRQRKQVVYDLFRRAMGGEDPLTVLGRADASRDLVFVADAAGAMLALARAAPAAGEPYNLASGQATTIEELAESILATLELKTPVSFTGTATSCDPLMWLGDASRA